MFRPEGLWGRIVRLIRNKVHPEATMIKLASMPDGQRDGYGVLPGGKGSVSVPGTGAVEALVQPLLMLIHVALQACSSGSTTAPTAST